jgi:hypothetical protein
MKPVRRLFVAIGAPLILIGGLGALWAYRQGADLIQQIETWGHELEHSSEPVTLHVSGFPVISTMYVDGDKIGKLDRVVVLRQEPGAVDSLRIVVAVEDPALIKQMSECDLRLDPEAMEDTFPLDGWKHLMSCASDTEGLVQFGSVVFDGAEYEAKLLLHEHDLPCDHMSDTAACDKKRDIRIEMRRLRDDIKSELRKGSRERQRSN